MPSADVLAPPTDAQRALEMVATEMHVSIARCAALEREGDA
jgi:hypothetical protein